MITYDKELPLLPVKRGREKHPMHPSDAPEPLAMRPYCAKCGAANSAQIDLRQQASDLQKQNATLRRTLRDNEEENAALRRQIAEYRRYINKQDEGLAQVIRTTCSAFESYRETVVEATRHATSGEEELRMYGAIDDSGIDHR